MQSNLKQGQCYKCSSTLSIPIPECIAQCEQCGRVNLFLCHVIKKEPNLNKMKIECTTCKDVYTVINCPKCKGFCGIKSFMNGFLYQCSCGSKFVYVGCNDCGAVLALPPGKNYEMIRIRCKGCNKQFRYKICSTCRSCIYKAGDDQNQIYLCQKKQCPSSGTGQHNNFVNPYGFLEPDSQQVKQATNYRISQFEQQTKNMKNNYKDLCRVCLDQQAVMINTSCYHLALCEKCAKDIEQKKEGKCPICRGVGKYQIVFRP